MPSLRKRKSEGKSSRNSGTPKRARSGSRPSTRSRSAGRTTTPRKSTRSPPARLQATKEEEAFENGDDYADPDLLNEGEAGDYQEAAPEESYVNSELLEDDAPESGRNPVPSEPKKLRMPSPLWAIFLVLVLCLDIPLCRMEYKYKTGSLTRAKTEFYETLQEPDVPCNQLINKIIPTEPIHGWDERCIQYCNKVLELSAARDEAKSEARAEHVIGNIAAMAFETLMPREIDSTKTCTEAFESLDKTNVVADFLSAGLAIGLTLLLLNIGTSLASKDVIHPNFANLLHIALNVTTLLAMMAYFYITGDLAHSVATSCKTAVTVFPVVMIVMYLASYLM